MNSWFIAAIVAAGIAAAAVPLLKRQAFRRGYFERSNRTDRSRSQRRTTVAGPALVVATVVGAAAAGEGGDPLKATAVVALIILATGWRAERSRHGNALVQVGRVVAAVAVPVCGIHATFTGTSGIDDVLTAAFVLAVMGSIAALYRVDGVAPAVAGVTAAGITALALASGQVQVQAVAAALFGGCAGVLLHSLPPAETSLGRTGGPFAGAVIALAAIRLRVPLGSPDDLVVPALLLGLPVSAAALALIAKARRPDSDRDAVHLDYRLARRGVRPNLVVVAVGGSQAALSALAYLAGDERLSWAAALAIGVAIAGVVLVLAFARNAHDEEPAGLRGGVRAAIAVGVLLVLAFGAYGGFVALSARTHLEAGRNAAQEGLDAARDGDVDIARVAFTRAHEEFDQADSLVGSPLLTAGRIVPVVGQNITAVQTVTDIGLDLAATGEELATRAGARDLRIVDGRLPVGATRKVSADLHAALGVLEGVGRKLDDVDSPYLIPNVDEAITTLTEKIGGVDEQVRVVDEAVALAPGLFGGDGPRRYFLIVQTPDELRGSGGLMGSFGEITAIDGDLDLPRLEPTRVLNDATNRERQAELLPSIYRSRYGGFLPDRFWQNITAPPDFPTTAAAVEAAYPATAGGQPVDGVVAVDPIGLAALLELTGPVQVDSWPVPISAENAKQVLLLDQYQQLDGDPRDDFLGDVANAVFDKITSGELDAPPRIVAALAPAVAGGHIRLHSANPAEQQLFAHIGAAGALPAATPDSIMLTTQNGSESKIDYYLHRSLDYRVRVDPSTGTSSARAEVVLRNDAPAGGDEYIVGGATGGPTAAGENRLFVTIYSPFLLDRVTLGGLAVPVSPASEGGLNAYTVLTRMPAGTTQVLVFDFHGQMSLAEGYQLNVGQQPTVNPDRVTVLVSGLDGTGYAITNPAASDPFNVDLVEPVTVVVSPEP